MSPLVKRTVMIAALSTLMALVVVGFAVLERSSVDPAVSAGWIGSSTIPVWYAPLAIFAIAHTLCLLATMRGRATPGLITGGMTVVLAVAFHVLGVPFLIGEMIYGTWLVFGLMFPPLFVVLPFIVMLAIGVPGALYGLSIYAPLAVARGFATADGIKDSPGPTRNALILGGIVVAFVCVVAFGVPSEAARAARGNYAFAPTMAQSAWRVMAPVVAICCAVIVFAGVWFRSTTDGATAGVWLKAFVLPVVVVLAAGGPALGVLETSAVLRAIRTMPGIEAMSRYFRDGRPRGDEPIRFANGELRVDRSLVRYRLADNPQRRITTVALHPPPELQAIGVIDRVILNAWHAEPHRKEAEYRRAVCADSASRPVVECHLPATGAVVIQIDREHPERGLQRGATLASQTGCLIIVTGVAGRSFGIRADFDCALADDWPRRAAEIERYITALHIVQ